MQDLTDKKSGGGFVAYARALTARLEDEHRPVAEKYRIALSRFGSHYGEGDMAWTDMTQTLVSDFESVMAKDVTRNTTSFYMRALQAIYNRAVREGLTDDRHPFAQVYTGVDKTLKRGLPITAIRIIKDYDLRGKPKMAFARDIFMLSFYLRGMSIVDMAWIRRSNITNGYLTYRRHKTSQTISVRWLPCMEEIVRQYAGMCSGGFLLPIISSGEEATWRKEYKAAARRINRYLMRLGEQLDLPVKLTTYVARHSWATAAQSQHIPISVISQCLGHDSETTTRIYLAAIDNSELDKANEVVIQSLGNI